jgi:hypothetical protein
MASTSFLALTGLIVSAGTASAQCPTVHRVQNYTDGALTISGFCDELPGEGEAAVISTIPPEHLPVQIQRIGIGCHGLVPGFSQTEAATRILPGDPLGMFGSPPALYSYPNPLVTDGQISVFDVSAASTPWIVGTQPFTVFLESNGTSCNGGFVAHDGDGCTPRANRFRGLSVPFTPGWYESCVYPFPQGPIGGDAVIWVEYVSLVACPIGTTTCFGDGSGTACPCGNAGASGRGCENSFTTGGGRLEAHGVASVSADSVQLRAAFLPPTSSALFFQGTALVAGGAGAAFGDGLRCVTGSVFRLGTNFAAGGLVDFGHGVAGNPLVGTAGAIPPGGGTREYQVWYRNTPAFCTSATYNLTNAVTVLWSI